jgi:hypothetical protein
MKLKLINDGNSLNSYLITLNSKLLLRRQYEFNSHGD